MVNSSQASLIMSDMQGLLIKKLETDGYIFPSLIVMSSDAPVRIDDLVYKYPCILNVEYSDNVQGAYVTRVTFRNRDEKDDEAIQKAIKEISFIHQPDAIGYFAQCLYKTMDMKDYINLTTDLLNKDPEAIRVFHNCFFVKNDGEKGFLMITPYMLSENKKEEMFNLDDAIKFTTTEVHKGWEVPTSALETRIPNPYL
jgi:hypothetical protein